MGLIECFLENSAHHEKNATDQKGAPKDFTAITLKGSWRIYQDVSQGKLWRWILFSFHVLKRAIAVLNYYDSVNISLSKNKINQISTDLYSSESFKNHSSLLLNRWYFFFGHPRLKSRKLATKLIHYQRDRDLSKTLSFEDH